MGYVICIDDSLNGRYLTLGKVYKILEKRDRFYYRIEDDNGKIRHYHRNRFQPVKSNNINRLLYKVLKCM